MKQMTRRSALAGLTVAVAVAGCRLYSDPAPVVIGGTAVSKEATAMAALRASSVHRRFVAAIEASELDTVLEGVGPFTVFAPNDEAFGFIRPKSAAKQIADDPGALKQVVLNHIVPARLTTEDLALALPQLNGITKIFARNNEVISVTGDEEKLRVLDMRKRPASLVVTDAIASNGIIHEIDGLLLPREESIASP